MRIAAACCMLLSACAHPVREGRFFVHPEVGSAPEGLETGVQAAVHDQAVRAGRTHGWIDSEDPSSAFVTLTFRWSREGAVNSDRVRLICAWKDARGGQGEMTDGLAMPAGFWTPTRAGDASERLCGAVLISLRAAGRGRAR